jgi:hypothetical protein
MYHPSIICSSETKTHLEQNVVRENFKSKPQHLLTLCTVCRSDVILSGLLSPNSAEDEIG